MTLDLVLQPVGFDMAGTKEISWNPETGEVIGTGATDVLALAELAREQGYVRDNISGLHTTKDPLTTHEGMAVLLASMLYKVPEQLQDDLPTVDDDPASDIAYF